MWKSAETCARARARSRLWARAAAPERRCPRPRHGARQPQTAWGLRQGRQLGCTRALGVIRLDGLFRRKQAVGRTHSVDRKQTRIGQGRVLALRRVRQAGDPPVQKTGCAGAGGLHRSVKLPGRAAARLAVELAPGRLAGGHLDDGARDRPDVGLPPVARLLDDLGRHPVRRALDRLGRVRVCARAPRASAGRGGRDAPHASARTPSGSLANPTRSAAASVRLPVVARVP